MAPRRTRDTLTRLANLKATAGAPWPECGRVWHHDRTGADFACPQPHRRPGLDRAMLARVDVLHDLRHRAGPPPVLLHVAEVPTDTWAGLLADGCYRRLTSVCALRTDVVENTDHRAQALPGPLPVKSVVARRTAAWVHLGGDPPRRLDLLVPPGRRVDPAPDRRCSEAHLAAHDVQVRRPRFGAVPF